MEFKYLNHTADVMFEAYGKTIEEAFENAGLAMFNILTDVKNVKKLVSFDITLKASTPARLLFDFLDELIFYLDTEGIIVSGFENTKIEKTKSGYLLKTKIKGDYAYNYETHGDIKAPTYNEMKIEKTKQGFKIRAVVDI